jgi:hypothetical protein
MSEGVSPRKPSRPVSTALIPMAFGSLVNDNDSGNYERDDLVANMSMMSPLTLAVAVAVAATLLLIAGLGSRRPRLRGNEALLRRARALDMLRHIAEHPCPIQSHTIQAEPGPVASVHVLDAANRPSAVLASPCRTTSSKRRRVIQRPDPDEVALRPTIAHLPTKPHSSPHAKT